MATNILIIGNGGREHALAWKLNQSLRIGKLFVASGNGGTSMIAENIPIKPSDILNLTRFAEKGSIDLTLVGPDEPLALGIVNAFESRGLPIFGPTRKAAMVESSKAFAKKLMKNNHIATAPFRVFRKHKNAEKYLNEHGAPVVIKANGLAQGKGVYPCITLNEAKKALKEIMLDHAYKQAGNELIIEDLLDGEEISIHAICDGKTSILFPSSQDHKRVYDNNKGLNTGGMGTIAPVPWFNNQALLEVDERIVQPALQALRRDGIVFTGCLYPGLMLSTNGIKVLEYNARFGDPETQSYMRLLKTDLLDILEACIEKKLDKLNVE